ncbi:hypothetical protein [Raineya orbicola]|uniref:Uncharacterized protein n=1 Tax=Raineya orbicola TaxID=2016530 RepID=A0A2N3IAN9_9BACT|nr:hypothetical protein [Raineya orbicola]PKQ67376.1 hypothetical protein Rain11_2055 [Raineya orbicola]
MTKIFSFAMFLLLSGSVALAQPSKKGVKSNSGSRNNSAATPEKVADELCNCINNFFNQYHPSIRQYIDDMLSLGEEKALEKFQNYLMSLPENEQKKAVDDAQKFSKDVEAGKLNICIDKFKNSASKMTEAQAQRVLDELEKSPACKLVDDLIKLGIQKEEKK